MDEDYTQYIREDSQLQSTPMMFVEDNRAKAEQIFQETKDELGHRYYLEDVDVLLGKNREMGVVLTLTKATVVILMKPAYMSALRLLDER